MTLDESIIAKIKKFIKTSVGIIKGEIMENEKAVSYDYKVVRVRREMETIVTDCYESLGWELTNTSSSEFSLFYLNLSFKRDRKIEHKNELLKLQDKLDTIIANIESLQSKKKNAGKPEAITMGVVGALTLGGGMSMTMLNTSVGMIAGGIAIGVVGIAIGLLGFLVHKCFRKKKGENIQPVLESEYDKLADICEQANKLTK